MKNLLDQLAVLSEVSFTIIYNCTIYKINNDWNGKILAAFFSLHIMMNAFGPFSLAQILQNSNPMSDQDASEQEL